MLAQRRLPVVGIIVGRELDVIERKVAQLPGQAPALDHGVHFLFVQKAIVPVALALVPDGAADRERRQGVDHAVVEGGRRLRVVVRIAGIERGLERKGRLGGQRLAGLANPGFPARQGLGQRVAVFSVLGRLRVEDGFHLGDGGEPHRRRPGLDERPAPGRLDQADGNAEPLVELEAEVKSDSRERPNRFGRARLPLRLHVLHRPICCALRDEEEPHARIVGAQDVRNGVGQPRHGPLHVGLPRAHPDLSDENVLDDDRGALGAADGHFERAFRRFRLERIEDDPPRPVGGSHGLLLLAVEQDRDRLVLAGPSPDRNGLVLLDDHVVADDRGQLDLSGQAAGQESGEDGRHDKPDPSMRCHVQEPSSNVRTAALNSGTQYLFTDFSGRTNWVNRYCVPLFDQNLRFRPTPPGQALRDQVRRGAAAAAAAG